MSVVTVRGALGHTIRGCMECGCTGMVFSMFVKFEVVGISQLSMSLRRESSSCCLL